MSKVARAVCMVEFPVDDSDTPATLDEKLQAMVKNITSKDFVFVDDDTVEVVYVDIYSNDDLNRVMGRLTGKN